MEQTYLSQQTFTSIFHLSDIHIRNDQTRQKEFHQQFQKTFQTIQQHPQYQPDTTLIVVTGDILDKGLLLSGIAIDLLRIFIDGLTKIAPTIIIPGNHDDKKDVGESQLDSLSAIFQHSIQNRPRLYYFKDSGIYHFGTNLVFGHTSVTDYQLIKASQIKNNQKIKIALFHGMIDTQTQNPNFLLKDCQFSISDFQGYHKVLLGDVHKYSQVGNQNIWYAGSLIQKSFAEDRYLHGGVLVWNLLNNLHPQYLPIPNSHAFVTLKVEKGIIKGEFLSNKEGFGLGQLVPFQPHTLPKQTSIKFKCDLDTTSSQIDKLVENLKSYTKIVFRRQQLEQLPKTNPKQITHTLPTLQEYLTNIKHPRKNELLKLDLKYLTRDTQPSGTGKWIPLLLKMNNIYNYQNEHQLNFQNLPHHDIISIHGKNGSGKSKILSTLLLAIYGCQPKELNHIITQGKKKASTLIEIQLNDDHYLIERQFTKNSKSIPPPTIHKNQINITSSSKLENQQFLIKILGAKEDLEDTHISKQGCHESFIHKKEKEQLQLLSKLFQTHTYADKEKKVKDELTDIRKQHKQIQNKLLKCQQEFIPTNQLLTQINEIQQHITNNQQILLQLEKQEKDNYQNKIQHQHYLEEKHKLQQKLSSKPITITTLPTKTLTEIEELRKNIQLQIQTNLTQIYPIQKLTDPTQQIQAIQQQLETLQPHITNNKPQTWTYQTLAEYPKYIPKSYTLKQLILEKNKLESNTLPNITQLHLEYQTQQDTLHRLHQKLIQIQPEIKKYQTTIQNDPYTYDTNCPHCQQNQNINCIPHIQTQLKTSQNECQQILQQLTQTKKYLDSHKNIPQYYQNFQKIQTIQVDICQLKLYQEYLQHKKFLENIQQTKQFQQKNNEYQQQLQLLEKEQTLYQNQKQYLTHNLQYETHNQQLLIQDKQLQQEQLILQFLPLQEKEKQLNQKIEQLTLIPQKQIDNEIKTTKKQITSQEKQLWNLQQQLDNMKKIETDILSLNQKLQQVTETKNLLEDYRKITNDYPLYANQKGIQNLEKNINFYLRNMSPNFTIQINHDKPSSLQFLKCDNKNKRTISIVDCSGFEKFIISICLRISLSNLSSSNSIHIMMIDEGFGVFDHDNIKLLPHLLDTLKHLYHQIFIITHIDILQTEIKHKIKIGPGPKIILP